MQIKGLENKMHETHTMKTIRKIIKLRQVFEQHRGLCYIMKVNDKHKENQALFVTQSIV